MNIRITIEYDNRDQLLDIDGLPEFIFSHIKNEGKEKLNVNLSIEHGLPPVEHSKIDRNRIIIPII